MIGEAWLKHFSFGAIGGKGNYFGQFKGDGLKR